MQLIHSRSRNDTSLNRSEADRMNGKTQTSDERKIAEFPVRTVPGFERDGSQWPCGSGLFFKGLSIDAKSEFDWLATRFQCPSNIVLIAEEQKPFSILFLLEGQVNISMNSSDGRRFLLEVAGAGDVLGLTSALSGDPSGISAETRYPCKVASVHRQDFLDFLLRHPAASQNAAQELSRHYVQACKRLRILGLASAVTERLACLLLEWCGGGRETVFGTEILCALTHGELGECIGASRESVSRALTELKTQKLVRQRGSILVVPSLSALAIFAGIDPLPDPDSPTA